MADAVAGAAAEAHQVLEHNQDQDQELSVTLRHLAPHSSLSLPDLDGEGPIHDAPVSLPIAQVQFDHSATSGKQALTAAPELSTDPVPSLSLPSATGLSPLKSSTSATALTPFEPFVDELHLPSLDSDDESLHHQHRAQAHLNSNQSLHTANEASSHSNLHSTAIQQRDDDQPSKGPIVSCWSWRFVIVVYVLSMMLIPVEYGTFAAWAATPAREDLSTDALVAYVIAVAVSCAVLQVIVYSSLFGLWSVCLRVCASGGGRHPRWIRLLLLVVVNQVITIAISTWFVLRLNTYASMFSHNGSNSIDIDLVLQQAYRNELFWLCLVTGLHIATLPLSGLILFHQTPRNTFKE